METPNKPSAETVLIRLSAKWYPEEIKFRPLEVRQIRNGQVRALPYVDARHVTERLNEVMGVAGWEDSYTPLPTGEVECRLTLLIDGNKVTKTDVGSPSEQPDAGDRMKAAYSDALKRAAVKFGVGLYLYRLGTLYADYDEQRKRITTVPALPSWAIPEDAAGCGKAHAEKLLALARTACERANFSFEKWQADVLRKYNYRDNCEFSRVQLRHCRQMIEGVNRWIGELAKGRPEGAAAIPPTVTIPETGEALSKKLLEWEGSLVGRNLCVPGALFAHIAAKGQAAAYPFSMNDWNQPCISSAMGWAVKFGSDCAAAAKSPGKPAERPAGQKV